jgi:hypothetical protein
MGGHWNSASGSISFASGDPVSYARAAGCMAYFRCSALC